MKGGAPSNSSCVFDNDDAELHKAITESLALHSKAQEARHQARQDLLSQLDPSLYIQNVLGDGACLFRAFGRSYPEQTSKSLHHSEIRATCVQHIRTSPHLRARFHSYEDECNYCNNMLLQDTYGDELCVTALTSLYHVQIHVHTPTHGILTFGLSGSPVLRLAYNL